jgi:hypothetical protein
MANSKRVLSNLMLLLASLGFAALAAELLLSWALRKSYQEQVSAVVAQRGGQPDVRSLVDFARAERARDPNVALYVWPTIFSDLVARTLQTAPAVLPLSGPARANTVYCDEGQGWLSFVADRFGFNNPDSAWDQPIDVMLVGDSYAFGQCVPTEYGPMAQLRALGRKGVSVGYSVTGTIAQYATFVEYVVPFKPRYVVWTIFENDVTDVRDELAVPLLREYLTPPHTQRLLKREAERDSAARAVVGLVLDGRVERTSEPGWRDRLLPRLKLWTLRGVANRVWPRPTPVPAEVQQSMGKALSMAKQRVDGWGGTLLIVYLPSWEEYRFGKTRNASLRHVVKTTAADLDIPVIDGSLFFERLPSIWEAFPLGDALTAHYSRVGFRLMAAGIDRALTAIDAQRPSGPVRDTTCSSGSSVRPHPCRPGPN